MQIFAAEAHAPRTRRSIDVAVVVVGVLLIAGLILITDDRAALEEQWLAFVEDIPTWVQWFADALYLSAWIYFLFLIIGLGLVARHRHDLLRDMVVALALTLGAAVLLTLIVSDEWPDLALFTGEGAIADSFPALSITMFTAAHATASPYLGRPLRRFGWTIILLASFASLFANLLLVRDVIGALLVGLVSAAVVHLVFGSPAGRPTLRRIAAAAAEIGVEVSGMVYAATQPESFSIVEATTSEGDPVRLSVLGRDAGSDNWVDQAWRFAWYEEAVSPFGAGRRQQVEHSALAQVLAERAGVNVAELVAVGVGRAGDALLISSTAGLAAGEVDGDALTDELLGAMWSEAADLHSAGILHGQLNAEHIMIEDDARVVLVDFEVSRVSVGPDEILPDRAELLVSTALLVGENKALAAAQLALGDEQLAGVLPFLQPAALTPELRRQVKAEHLSLKEFRAKAAELTGADDISLEKLRRVSLAKVLMNAVTVLAVYAVMTGLAQIGFAEILDAILSATWSMVIVALVLVQFTNLAAAVTVVGAAPKPMPLGITTIEQLAISFINLAVPSTAARVAVNMRFYQRFGIGTTAAATSGLLTSLSGFAVQVFLLVILIVIGDQSIDWDQIAFSGTVVRLIILAAAIGLVALAVMFAVRRMRRWIMEKIREPLRDVGGALSVLRSPKKATQIFGGNLVEQLLYATGLTICVYAVGGSVSLPEVIFINTIVSLFAGLMPIPGGIGVTEAGLSAGLIATGVPEETAFAAVIIYRLCTYYLPPIWGWFAMHWLTDRDYL